MLAAVVATWVAAIGMAVDSHNDASARCYFDGPYPGAGSNEHFNVAAAYATAFPAGRYCLWRGVDGSIVVYQTGWVATWVALVFFVLACAALLVLLRTKWWVPGALGMAVVILGWMCILLTSDTFLSPVFWNELPPDTPI